MSDGDQGAADGAGSDGSDWDRSAAAWIASMDDRASDRVKPGDVHAEAGDWSRLYVLDPPMLELVRRAAPRTALDVGCGEGRFCRLMSDLGVHTVGLDPTAAMLHAARERHPAGIYREGRAEALPFTDGSFDLVVSYVSLVDIVDFRTAIAEMARVLVPSGRLLIANLSAQGTAMDVSTLVRDENGATLTVAKWLDERPVLSEWAGISVTNWHRPLSAYMDAFLKAGLRLTHFDEPSGASARLDTAVKYGHCPWFVVMEWEKPA